MEEPRDSDLVDIYSLHRKYIEHEDDLIHQRITTLITIQSFLLATFGFTFQKKIEIVEKLYEQHQLPFSSLGLMANEFNWFLIILAIVGAGTSILALLSIRAASVTIDKLREHWLQVAHHHPPAYLPGIIGGGDDKIVTGGSQLATRVPWFLLILWAIIFLFLLATICT